MRCLYCHGIIRNPKFGTLRRYCDDACRTAQRLRLIAAKREAQDFGQFLVDQRHRLNEAWNRSVTRIQTARRQARLEHCHYVLESRGYTYGGVDQRCRPRVE